MSKGYSGYGGTVEIGNTPVDIDVQGWSVDLDGGGWDSSTTGDGGWTDKNQGLSGLSGTCTLLYNKDKNPLKPTSATPAGLGLRQGGTIDKLTLNVNKPDGEALYGKAFIDKMSIKSDAKGGIIVTLTFSNKGPWHLPGDTA